MSYADPSRIPRSVTRLASVSILRTIAIVLRSRRFDGTEGLENAPDRSAVIISKNGAFSPKICMSGSLNLLELTQFFHESALSFQCVCEIGGDKPDEIRHSIP